MDRIVMLGELADVISTDLMVYDCDSMKLYRDVWTGGEEFQSLADKAVVKVTTGSHMNGIDLPKHLTKGLLICVKKA